MFQKIKKKLSSTVILVFLIFIFTSCNNKPIDKKTPKKQNTFTLSKNPETVYDKRKSLKLNAMQKNHQLMNMRDHLEAVQKIIALLASDKYDQASKIAYTKLGATTKMKLMCASFGDKNFERLGLEFHKRADNMSKIFKNKEKSLKALSNTMNYCVRCYATYRQ